MTEESQQFQEPIEQTKEPVELQMDERNHHLLQCPNCSHFVSAIDINIDKTIAKCSNCSHVFDFSHEFDLEGTNLDYQNPRPEMLIPDGLEVLRLGSELDIEVNWFRSTSKAGMAFMIFFTLVWNLMLLPFVIGAIASGQFQVLLFSGIHIAVGISMIYNLATLFLNTSTINVTKDHINISTTPLRVLRKRDQQIPTKDIDQLYVTKYVSSRKNGQANYAHALYAIRKNGKKVKLLDKMNKETQMYLEQEIESFLQIKNRRVAGEVRK